MLTTKVLGKTEKYKENSKKSPISFAVYPTRLCFVDLKKNHDQTVHIIPWLAFFYLTKYWKYFVFLKYFSRSGFPWQHGALLGPSWLFGPASVSTCTGTWERSSLEQTGKLTKASWAPPGHFQRPGHAPHPLSSPSVCFAMGDQKGTKGRICFPFPIPPLVTLPPLLNTAMKGF